MEETESVCVMVVPFATVAPTVTTKVKFAVVLAGMVVVSVQVKASAQVHPAGPVNDTNVVFGGQRFSKHRRRSPLPDRYW